MQAQVVGWGAGTGQGALEKEECSGGHRAVAGPTGLSAELPGSSAFLSFFFLKKYLIYLFGCAGF